MSKNIRVSVYCLAFNHAKYIRKTLDGFVNQKTNFEYEVFVHDDASKDETQEIILEYANKYPNIIIPILQTENQYSKGVSIRDTIIFPQVKGDYIAICEGDDYWCNPNKLQKQVDYLDNHPDCIACVHNTRKLINGKLSNEFFNYKTTDGYLSVKDLVFSGANQFQTSAIMYRKRIMFEDRPDFFNLVKGIGDYPLSVSMAVFGKVYYYSDVMSVYRVNSTNSWTQRTMKNIDKFLLLKERCILMLEEANKFSNYKYDEDFKLGILCQKYEYDKFKGKRLNVIKYFPVIVYKIIRKIKFLLFKINFKLRGN